jgi:hypothetical protein
MNRLLVIGGLGAVAVALRKLLSVLTGARRENEAG